MDDGGAEATLAGDRHHALRLIGQGERAQGASYHRLLLWAGPLPAQHCRCWICAERQCQLRPGGPWRKWSRGTDRRGKSANLKAGRGTGHSKAGASEGRSAETWGQDGATGAGHAPGLHLSWPPKGQDPSSACHRRRLRRQYRTTRRHTSAWLCWGCCSSPGTWEGTRQHEGKA